MAAVHSRQRTLEATDTRGNGYSTWPTSTPRWPMADALALVPAESVAGTTTGNWKMATEGGGRHSPSTVFWEEEGVPAIVRGHPW